MICQNGNVLKNLVEKVQMSEHSKLNMKKSSTDEASRDSIVSEGGNRPSYGVASEGLSGLSSISSCS